MSSFAPNSTGFPALPHNGAEKWLADADIRSGTVAAVVVHVLLLRIERADRRKPVCFPSGKGSAQSNLFVDSGRFRADSAAVSQLLCGSLRRFLRLRLN